MHLFFCSLGLFYFLSQHIELAMYLSVSAFVYHTDHIYAIAQVADRDRCLIDRLYFELLAEHIIYYYIRQRRHSSLVHLREVNLYHISGRIWIYFIL